MPTGAPGPSFDRVNTSSDRFEVVIAGAGVAALETMMALRSLAGPRVAITLVAPEDEFVYRPLAVAAPFGLESVPSYPLGRIAADFGATHLHDRLSWVGPGGQRVFLESGDELGYDALVVALGARAVPAWPFVPTFRGPLDVQMARGLVKQVGDRELESIAFVVPSGITWALPIYELALQLAATSQTPLDIALYTPEMSPLAVLGEESSGEVAQLLEDAGIRLHARAVAEVTPDGEVIVGGEGRRFDRVVALPRLEGPAPRGLPCDDDGFLPVDRFGMVHHVQHVYAAGDGTNYPIKQGGLATQQADAVAEVVAKRAGARVDPRPVRPILRTRLLANGASRYLRTDLHARDGGVSESSDAPLWWPDDKIAGTYLSPYLATVR
jgi:sulfide:quinone oxidoreductase